MHKLSAFELGQLVGRSARIRMDEAGRRRHQKLLTAKTYNGSDPWRQGRKPPGRTPNHGQSPD